MLVFSLVKKRGGGKQTAMRLGGGMGGGEGINLTIWWTTRCTKRRSEDNTRTPLLVPINLLLRIVSISPRGIVVITLVILLIIHPPALFAWWMVVKDADNAV